MSFDPFYNDNGEHVGFVAEADDGAAVLFDHDGNMVVVLGADGEHLDPTEYEIVDADPGSAPAADVPDRALAAEIAALQAMAADNAEARDIEQAEWEHTANAANAARQFDDLEKRIGRELTVNEMRDLATHVREQIEAGREADVQYAVDQLEAEARPLLDLSTRQGRVDYMNRRLAEGNRENEGSDLLDQLNVPNVASAERYDMATHEGRAAFMNDKLAGIDTEGRTYDGADVIEADGDEVDRFADVPGNETDDAEAA